MKEQAGQEENPSEQSEVTQGKSEVTQGKGRRDEVGRSGIYPFDAENAPENAEVITPGDVNDPHKDR